MLGTQVPPAGQDLNSAGYSRFHCYSLSQIQLFEAYLALDASHAIQSCATIWGSMMHSSHTADRYIALLPKACLHQMTQNS